MEFVLVRHAQPAWVQDGAGVTNPGLTSRGYRQAEQAAERLAGFGFDEIWVSPLIRAQETAAPLLERTDIQAQTHDWLAEASPPDLDGKTPEEIAAFFGGSRRRTISQWWQGGNGAEPLRDFVKRVGDGMDAVIKARSGGHRDDTSEPPLWHSVEKDTKVCIVSHAGTTAATVSHLLGLPQVPWAWERFYPLHASISRVKTIALADGLIFSLRSFSLADHMADEDHTR